MLGTTVYILFFVFPTHKIFCDFNKWLENWDFAYKIPFHGENFDDEKSYDDTQF